MTLQIEEGKYYRTRDGRKVGPMGIYYGGKGHKFYDCEGGDREWSGYIWYPDGDNYQILEADLVAEWRETEENTEDTPKMWKDMTDEEKGALLLAYHEGKDIEFWCVDEWMSLDNGPSWLSYHAYQVKPAPKEPKRETVTLENDRNGGWSFYEDSGTYKNTHKITFDLIDGVPDCDSIKMEEL